MYVRKSRGRRLTDPGYNHHSDFANDFREIVPRCEIYYGVGRGCGVGRGLGVTRGGAVGVTVGVPLGVAVAVAVGVGVGVPAGQVPLTLNTICMLGKPRSPVGVGSFTPQSTALR
jgi:hypothetical protein